MNTHDPEFEAAFSALANALQTAMPLTTRVRLAVGETSEDLLTLEDALERAVRAVRALRQLRQQSGAP